MAANWEAFGVVSGALLRDCGPDHLGVDEPRTDGVHSYSVRGDFLGQVADEAQYACLCSGVMGSKRVIRSG